MSCADLLNSYWIQTVNFLSSLPLRMLLQYQKTTIGKILLEEIQFIF